MPASTRTRPLYYGPSAPYPQSRPVATVGAWEASGPGGLTGPAPSPDECAGATKGLPRSSWPPEPDHCLVAIPLGGVAERPHGRVVDEARSAPRWPPRARARTSSTQAFGSRSAARSMRSLVAVTAGRVSGAQRATWTHRSPHLLRTQHRLRGDRWEHDRADENDTGRPAAGRRVVVAGLLAGHALVAAPAGSVSGLTRRQPAMRCPSRCRHVEV
jgi:hypothetical protein